MAAPPGTTRASERFPASSARRWRRHRSFPSAPPDTTRSALPAVPGLRWKSRGRPRHAAIDTSVNCAAVRFSVLRVRGVQHGLAAFLDLKQIASAGDGGLDYRFVTPNKGANWTPLNPVDAPVPSARHRFHHNVL